MSAPEDRFGEAVHDVLHGRPELRPSADLFSRVVDSIDADRRRRRRPRGVVLLWAAGLVLVHTAVRPNAGFGPANLEFSALIFGTIAQYALK